MNLAATRTVPAVLLAIGLVLASVVAFPSPASAATLSVTNPADTADPGTIRAAAAAAALGDTINIEVDLAPQSTVVFPNGVTIVGVGTRTITRGANADFPIFTLDPIAVLHDYTISNLTFTGGTGTGPAVQADVAPAVRTLTIDDVTFQNHTATAGAALDLEALSVGLVVRDSTFTGNTATVGDGGAIRATLGQGGIDIRDTTFIGNTAQVSGGAAYVTGGAANPYLVQNVTATGNMAVTEGGGAFALSGGFGTTITGSTFGANQALNAGGGAYINSSRTTTITDTTFTANVSAGNRGGGLLLSGSPLGYTLSGLTFTGNHGNVSGGGLGLFDVTATGTLSASTFTLNTANGNGGGMVIQNSQHVQATNLTFNNNTAQNGGAVYVQSMLAPVDFENSSFIGNHAVSSSVGSGNGGAIAVNALTDELSVFRSRIVGNTAESTGNSAYGAGIYLDGITSTGWLDVGDSEFSENVLTPGPDGDGVSIAFDAMPSDAYSRFFDSTFAEFDSPAGLANIFFAGIATGVQIQMTSLTVVGSVGMRALANAGDVTIADTVFDTTSDSLDVADSGFELAYSALTSALSASVVDGGNNLFALADPKLGPLQNNGGPTRSMLPLTGSALIDRGNPGGHDSYDQRGVGFPRVNNGRIDIGAVETPGALAATGQGVTWWVPVLGGVLLLAGIAAFVIARMGKRRAQ